MNVSNGFKRTVSVVFSLVLGIFLGNKLASFIFWDWYGPMTGSNGSILDFYLLLFIWPICVAIAGITSYLTVSTLIKTFLQKGVSAEDPAKPFLLSFLSVMVALIAAITTTELLIYLAGVIFPSFTRNVAVQDIFLARLLSIILGIAFPVVAFIFFTILFLKISHKFSSKNSQGKIT